MDPAMLEKILSDGFLKTAEDWEAAGRIAARAYQDEMTKLCQIFGTGPEPKAQNGRDELAELLSALGQ